VIPRGEYIPVLGGVLIGIVASFLVGSAILRIFPVREVNEDEVDETLSEPVPSTVPAA
jgi:PTS system mannitol-specific IIC component